MIQLVVVHGVATRPGREYDAEVANRNALLKSILFDNQQVAISTPLWGDLVPAPAWNGASFQHLSNRVTSLSILGGLAVGSSAIAGNVSNALVDVAQVDANGAIDALFAALVENADREGRALKPDEIAQFRIATDYLSGEPANAPLSAPTSSELVKMIRIRIGVQGSYGITDTLKKAATSIVEDARNLVGKGLVALARDSINPAVARFLGDIFVYLKPGPIREAIRNRLVDALNTAFDAAAAAGNPLIVMGHSLGGVILYDLMSSAATSGLKPGFRVDAFITVGSQPGLFEELGLFDYQAPGRAPPTPIAGPAVVAHWLNIIDPIDPFGFRAQPIFDMAADYEFDSGTGLASSHTTYFKRPLFHARLRKRLTELGLI